MRRATFARTSGIRLQNASLPPNPLQPTLGRGELRFSSPVKGIARHSRSMR